MIKKERLPNKKMTATGIGGAVTLVIVWAAGAIFGIEVPPEVAVTLPVIVSWLAGYFTPETITKIVETVTDAVEDSTE